MDRQLSPSSHVLVTGVTGLIGGELTRALVTTPGTGTVWPLIRPTDEGDADARFRRRMGRGRTTGLLERPVRPVDGDVCRPDWGLAAHSLADIRGRVDVILHNAADTSFAAHRDTGRTNVSSVERLIEFARGCRRPPLVVYMSTASNVGVVRGREVHEDDGCRPDDPHHNEYTRSKAVGERLLRASGLPVLVLRPTIVLSRGLSDAAFARQILWCVPLTRMFAALPIDPAARLDIVPVDFVVNATLRLLAGRRRWDSYHLSAGTHGAVTVGEVARAIDTYYARRSPLRLIRPEEWDRGCTRKYASGSSVRRKAFRALRHYLPFLNMDTVYDDTRLRAEPATGRLTVDPVTGYLPDLLGLIRTRAAIRESALP